MTVWLNGPVGKTTTSGLVQHLLPHVIHLLHSLPPVPGRMDADEGSMPEGNKRFVFLDHRSGSDGN